MKQWHKNNYKKFSKLEKSFCKLKIQWLNKENGKTKKISQKVELKKK